MLRARGVAFVFNQWSDGTALDFQLDQPGCWTAPFAAARLLTRPGTDYEERERQMLPYDRVKEPFPEAQAAAQRMVAEAAQHNVRPLFVLFGNKLEGCAPLSAKQLAEALEAALPEP